jgi:Ni,Fe-hydrogenase maturation factor
MTAFIVVVHMFRNTIVYADVGHVIIVDVIVTGRTPGWLTIDIEADAKAYLRIESVRHERCQDQCK